MADPALEAATADTDIDEESFRSDLERDSAHSSLVNGQMSAAVNGEASRRRSKPISEHEARYEQLLMQGKTSSCKSWYRNCKSYLDISRDEHNKWM